MGDRLADAERGLRHVFIRDLILPARIGVHAHEQRGTQRIRLNVDLAVTDETAAGGAAGPDQLSRVVDYERVVSDLRKIVDAGHIRLVETLAEKLALACLKDERVRIARVRVEKLDILPDAVSAGVEVERRR